MAGTPLLIFPCNGNGLEALDCAGDEWHVLGFVDDTPDKQKGMHFGLPVWPRRALREHPEASVLAVPGGPTSFRLRRQVIEGLGVEPHRFARVVHPSARVSPLATLGTNVLVMAGVVVTSNAVVGDHVCVLPNTVVHHDAVIGDWTLIGAGVVIAGSVRIGAGCYVGSGSNVLNGIHVGEAALVGLGSNVLRDVAAGVTVAGNPARVLRPAVAAAASP